MKSIVKSYTWLVALNKSNSDNLSTFLKSSDFQPEVLRAAAEKKLSILKKKAFSADFFWLHDTVIWTQLVFIIWYF